MELGLKGKVVLVTGSSKGIGRSIAEAFAREGCAGCDQRPQREGARSGCGRNARRSATVHAVLADMTEAEGAKRSVDETVRRFGTIHVLVNNAGGAGRFGSFADLTDDEWIGAFNLNVLSAVRATRAALPHMQKQKWGRIINISSESGVQPDAMMPHYNASKSALNSLTKSLSKAYGKDGILVNTVSPAFIRTPLLDGLLEQQARARGITLDEAEKVLAARVSPEYPAGPRGQTGRDGWHRRFPGIRTGIVHHRLELSS